MRSRVKRRMRSVLKTSRIRRCQIIGILFLFSLLFGACGSENTKIDRDKATIGLVVTTAQAYDSKILWFDADLENNQIQKLHYAMLGSHFAQPIVKNGKIFLIPQGLDDRKDTRKVISIDKKDLAIQEYPFSNIALNYAECIGENVYAINTLNGVSTLERYHTLSQQSQKFEREGEVFNQITAASDKLYCFSMRYDPDNPDRFLTTLRIFTPDLQMEKEIDLSEYGMTSGKALDDQEYLYVTVSHDSYDNRIGRILKINKSTYEIQKFDSEEGNVFDIFRAGDQFIFTHYDPVVNEGGRISIWDGKDSEKIVDLETPLTLTGISGKRFVVANDNCIRLYSMDNFQLLKAQKIELDSRKYKFYTSSLLFVDE